MQETMKLLFNAVLCLFFYQFAYKYENSLLCFMVLSCLYLQDLTLQFIFALITIRMQTASTLPNKINPKTMPGICINSAIIEINA